MKLFIMDFEFFYHKSSWQNCDFLCINKPNSLDNVCVQAIGNFVAFIMQMRTLSSSMTSIGTKACKIVDKTLQLIFHSFSYLSLQYFISGLLIFFGHVQCG